MPAPPNLSVCVVPSAGGQVSGGELGCRASGGQLTQDVKAAFMQALCGLFLPSASLQC